MSIYSSLTVVMPYYKNERTLTRCLRSICAQKIEIDCSVVVVDDGGPVRAKNIVDKYKWPISIQVLEGHGSGQSEATNIGVRGATGDLIVLTCADIIFTPNFLMHHLETHAYAREPEGVIGHIVYAPWVQMTPLMHYLDSPGPQFNFEIIKDPSCVAAGHVYAPNFSAQRKKLLEQGPFDPVLVYGFQDVDLGMRLQSTGMNFRYAEKAVALHDHPNSLSQFFDRQRRVGRMLPYMMKKHPKSGFARRFEKICDEAEPLLRDADMLLNRISELERKICSSPGAFTAFRKPLFETYDVVMLLGFILGVLQNSSALREVEAYSPATIRRFLKIAERMDKSADPTLKLSAVLQKNPTTQPTSCA